LGSSVISYLEALSSFTASTSAMTFSTGANLVAALRLAARLGPDATVVTIACDSGMKYLSTPLYAGAA
jgi:cysteine synthase